MNGKGGCCIARYGGGGGGGGMYGMSKVDMIMLKFRPIAPKPVADRSGSTTENGDGYVKCVRSKRKYVRANKNKKKKDNSKSDKMKVKTSSPPVVTLPLLPETPDRKENLPVTGCSDLLSPVHTKESNNTNNKISEPAPVWLSFNNQEKKVCYGHAGWVDSVVMKPAPPLPPAPRRPEVVSYVTVECVTDTWVEFEGLGCTDEEGVRNMEKDSCPGFISDGQDKVVWTNMAYREMVGVGEDMVVVLIRKDKWTPTSPLLYPAFTCKVKVTSQSHRQTSSQTLTLPCDVWRMECGAWAWRLDVKAALSLGPQKQHERAPRR